MRAPSAAAVVLLLSGCLPFNLWNREERHDDPELDQKVVLTKEEPVSLIAADGSRCLVGEEKFAHVRVGDRVWCVWSVKNARRTPYSWGGAHEEPPGERRKPGSSGSSGLPDFDWP